MKPSEGVQQCLNEISALLQFNEMEVDDGFGSFDEDEKGWFSLEDFIRVSNELQVKIDPEKTTAKDVFAFFDQSHSGRVDLEAWRNALKHADATEVRKLLVERGVTTASTGGGGESDNAAYLSGSPSAPSSLSGGVGGPPLPRNLSDENSNNNNNNNNNNHHPRLTTGIRVALNQIVALLMYNDVEVSEGFNLFDQNEKGTMTLTEFQTAAQELQLQVSEHDTVNLFHFMDSDSSGKVDREKWASALAHSNLEEVRHILAERGVDLDEILAAKTGSNNNNNSNNNDAHLIPPNAALSTSSSLLSEPQRAVPTPSESVLKALNELSALLKFNELSISEGFSSFDQQERGFFSLQEFKDVSEELALAISEDVLKETFRWMLECPGGNSAAAAAAAAAGKKPNEELVSLSQWRIALKQADKAAVRQLLAERGVETKASEAASLINGNDNRSITNEDGQGSLIIHVENSGGNNTQPALPQEEVLKVFDEIFAVLFFQQFTVEDGFNSFDINERGYFSLDEFKSVLSDINVQVANPATIEAAFKLIDSPNSTGNVDLAKWKNAQKLFRREQVRSLLADRGIEASLDSLKLADSAATPTPAEATPAPPPPAPAAANKVDNNNTPLTGDILDAVNQIATLLQFNELSVADGFESMLPEDSDPNSPFFSEKDLQTSLESMNIAFAKNDTCHRLFQFMQNCAAANPSCPSGKVDAARWTKTLGFADANAVKQMLIDRGVSVPENSQPQQQQTVATNPPTAVSSSSSTVAPPSPEVVGVLNEIAALLKFNSLNAEDGFSSFDAEERGWFTQKEFGERMEEFQIGRSEVIPSVFAFMDRSNLGRVDFEKWKLALSFADEKEVQKNLAERGVVIPDEDSAAAQQQQQQQQPSTNSRLLSPDPSTPPVPPPGGAGKPRMVDSDEPEQHQQHQQQQEKLSSSDKDANDNKNTTTTNANKKINDEEVAAAIVQIVSLLCYNHQSLDDGFLNFDDREVGYFVLSEFKNTVNDLQLDISEPVAERLFEFMASMPVGGSYSRETTAAVNLAQWRSALQHVDVDVVRAQLADRGVEVDEETALMLSAAVTAPALKAPSPDVAEALTQIVALLRFNKLSIEEGFESFDQHDRGFFSLAEFESALVDSQLNLGDAALVAKVFRFMARSEADEVSLADWKLALSFADSAKVNDVLSERGVAAPSSSSSKSDSNAEAVAIKKPSSPPATTSSSPTAAAAAAAAARTPPKSPPTSTRFPVGSPPVGAGPSGAMFSGALGSSRGYGANISSANSVGTEDSVINGMRQPRSAQQTLNMLLAAIVYNHLNAEKAFRTCESSGDRIRSTSFETFLSRLAPRLTGSEREQLWHFLDENEDGFIDEDEWYRGLRKAQADEVLRILHIETQPSDDMFVLKETLEHLREKCGTFEEEKSKQEKTIHTLEQELSASKEKLEQLTRSQQSSISEENHRQLAEEKSALEKKSRTLEEELQKVQSELDTALKHHQASAASSSSSSDNLLQELREQKAAVEQKAKADLATAKSEYEAELKSVKEKSNASIKKLMDDLDSLQTDLSNALRKADTLNKKNEELSMAVATAAATAPAASADKKEDISSSSALHDTQQIQQLQKQVEDLQRQLHDQRQQQPAPQVVRDDDRLSTHLLPELDRLQEDLNRALQRGAVLAKRNEELAAELSNARSAAINNSFNPPVARAVDQVKKKKKTLSDEEETDDKEEEIYQLREQLQALEQDLAEARSRASEIEAVQIEMEEHRGRCAELAEINRQLREELSAFEEEIESTDVQNELSRLRLQLQSLTEENSRLMGTHEDGEAAAAAAGASTPPSAANTGNERPSADQEREIRSLRSRISDLEEKISRLEAENSTLETKSKDAEDAQLATESQMTRTEKILSSLQGQHEKLEEARDKLEEDLQKAKNELESALSLKRDLATELENLRVESKTLRARCEELEAENKKLEEKGTSAVQDAADTVKSLKRKLDEMEGALSDKEKQLKANKETLEELETENRKLKDQRDRESQMAEGAASTVKSLRQQIDDLELEKSRSKKEIERLQHDVDASDQRVRNERSKLEQSVEELRDKWKEERHKRDELDATIAKLEKKIDLMNHTRQTVESELLAEKRSREEESLEFVRLQKELRDLHGTVEGRSAATLRRENQELHRQIAQLSGEVLGLTQALEDVTKRAQQHGVELTTLQRRMQRAEAGRRNTGTSNGATTTIFNNSNSNSNWTVNNNVNNGDIVLNRADTADSEPSGSVSQRLRPQSARARIEGAPANSQNRVIEESIKRALPSRPSSAKTRGGALMPAPGRIVPHHPSPSRLVWRGSSFHDDSALRFDALVRAVAEGSFTHQTPFDIIVEHCLDCALHDSSLRHNAEKYKRTCNKTVSALNSYLQDFNYTIVVNPADQNDDGRPRLGAFEVYIEWIGRGSAVMRVLMFSKLESRCFPHPQRLALGILDALENRSAGVMPDDVFSDDLEEMTIGSDTQRST